MSSPALPAAAALPAWLEAVAADRSYRWAVNAWRRAARQPGAWFDAAKADAVVAAWPRWFRLTSDRFAGVPFRLTLWQEIIVRLLVGWKVPSEAKDPRTGLPVTHQVRLFRRLLLWVPRKNGKTEFLAALALLFFIYERVHAAEGYCFARDEDQARIGFNRMKAMLLSDPALTGGATPRVTMTSRGIYVAERQSLFQLLSGKPDGKHGRMPQVILGDEMHEWESRELEDNLRQGSGSRLQPIELYASTAGIKSKVTGFSLWEESLAIAEDQSDDDRTLAAIFAADPDDDWQDETVWAKANPTLGLTPVIDYLRGEAKKARNNPRAEATFRRYHLNQWVEQVERWLTPEAWASGCPDPTAWRGRLEAMRGRRAFAGMDLSTKRDLTALVWLFPPEEAGGAYIVCPRFWVPEESFEKRAATDRHTPWKTWRDLGAVEVTPGNAVDQNFVMKALGDGMTDFEVERIGFDSWNAQKLVTDMAAEGAPLELFREVRMGVRSMGEPSAEFDRLVYSGRIDHGGHPVLKWMAGNAAVRFDENMNFMPAKRKSGEHIDGIVATVMALAVSMAGGPAPARSPYDTDPNFSMAVQ